MLKIAEYLEEVLGALPARVTSGRESGSAVRWSSSGGMAAWRFLHISALNTFYKI